MEVALLMDVGQPLEDRRAPLSHQLLWQQSLASLHELVQVALLRLPGKLLDTAVTCCMMCLPMSAGLLKM